MRGGVKHIDSPGERQIGVRGPQGGRRDPLKVLSHQHSPRLCGAGKRGIFRVGYKGELAGSSLFDPLDPGDLLFLIAMAGGAKYAGEFAKLHAGDCTGLMRTSFAV